jgi:hypothetical protein
MARLKEKRPKRATVTVDVGRQGLQLLAALEKYAHGLRWDVKAEKGLSNYSLVTRSVLIRWALIVLAEREGVDVPTGYRPW